MLKKRRTIKKNKKILKYQKSKKIKKNKKKVLKRGGTLNEELMEYLKNPSLGVIANNNVGCCWEEIDEITREKRQEYVNEELSKALERKQTFTIKELIDFGIEYALSTSIYVKSGDKFFSPTPIKPTRLLSRKEEEKLKRYKKARRGLD